MTEHRHEDEPGMIDYLLGRCEEPQRRETLRRLPAEEGLRRLHKDLSNALAALDLLPETEAPEDLTARTMARIRQEQRMRALVAKQEASRPPAAPTFSLRELAAMAAAVLVLATVLFPSFRQGRRNALVAECASNVGRIGTAMLAYANANNGQLPAVGAPVRRWMPAGGAATASNSAALFRLVRQNYAAPPLFQCPAEDSGSFVVQAGMTDFPADRYVGYSYQHSLKGRLACCESQLGRARQSMVILADRTPVFARGTFRRDRMNASSENHGGTGQNVLYLDGHVAWAAQPTAGVNGDHIYLVQGVSEYRGEEVPASATDSFLLPALSPPADDRP